MNRLETFCARGTVRIEQKLNVCTFVYEPRMRTQEVGEGSTEKSWRHKRSIPILEHAYHCRPLPGLLLAYRNCVRVIDVLYLVTCPSDVPYASDFLKLSASLDLFVYTVTKHTHTWLTSKITSCCLCCCVKW